MSALGPAGAVLAQASAYRRAGNVGMAGLYYRFVLEDEPDNLEALHFLGMSHLRADKPALALPFLGRVAALHPERADIHRALGDAFALLRRPEQAIAAYRRVLALHPADPPLWIALGNLLQSDRRHEEALAAYEPALAAWPDDADILNNRGAALRALGRHDEAIAAYRRALARRPDDPDTLCNLANALRAVGLHEDAADACRRALAMGPDWAPALYGLGCALQALGRLDEAAVAYERALASAPRHVDAGNNLGTVLLALKRPQEAFDRYRRALAAGPGRTATLVNLGTALEALDRHQEAVGFYRRAVAVAPDLAAAHFNLGNALAALEEREAAIAAFDRAVALQPEEAEFRFNRAHCLLALGRLEAGWDDFAFLWTERRMRRRPYPQPLWDGQPTAAKVVVWGEQGIGDEVLAAGLLGDAAARTGGLVVECDRRLVPVLRRSWPAIEVVPRAAVPDPAGLAPEVAFQAPMTLLPIHVRRRWDAFPDHDGYLRPDPARAASLRAAYRARGQGPVVGISWRSVNARLGARKSLDLAGWAPILRVPGITFVSLQYGDCRAELDEAAAATGATIVHDPGVDSLVDVDAFVAQVAAMDLIVTVSNSTAHFAGAVGRPCWLLLPRTIGLLWYWLMCRGDSCPWYPSLRVFRQPGQGEWPPVVAAVAAALAERTRP